MEWFEIVVGISSVGSFIVAVIALIKIREVEKSISMSNSNSNKTAQRISNNEINESSVKQVGRDY